MYLFRETLTKTATEESTSRVPLTPPTLRADEPVFLDALSIPADTKKTTMAEAEATIIAVSALLITVCAIHAVYASKTMTPPKTARVKAAMRLPSDSIR